MSATKTGEALIAEMVEELAELPPIPRRLLLNPRLFRHLHLVWPAATPTGLFPLNGFEVRESPHVQTWAIEMTDGSFQLPEDELEEG